MEHYVLTGSHLDKYNTSFTYVYPVSPDNVGEAPRCPVCGRFTGSLPWLPPYRAELEVFGSAYGDIIQSPGVEVLISRTFREKFLKRSLVGLSGFHQVKIVLVKSKKKIKGKIPNYSLCAISRSRAVINDTASEFVREFPSDCSECKYGGINKSAARLIFERNSWSGEDIFVARGLPGVVFVSEKVKIMCENEGLVGGGFIPANQYSFNYYPSRMQE